MITFAPASSNRAGEYSSKRGLSKGKDYYKTTKKIRK
jgi:hypothetical protein